MSAQYGSSSYLTPNPPPNHNSISINDIVTNLKNPYQPQNIRPPSNNSTVINRTPTQTTIQSPQLTNIRQVQSIQPANTLTKNQYLSIPQQQAASIRQVQSTQPTTVITNNQHLNTAQRGYTTTQKIVPPTAPPPKQRRVQMVPYQQKYIDYVPQKVMVPVQKLYTDYYQIQHIVDYIPIQKEDYVYVQQPQEVVTMKLQYVPVEQKIVHMKEEDVKYFSNNSLQQHQMQIEKPIGTANYQQFLAPQATYVQEAPYTIRKSKTNYVTAEGYNPNEKLREIDRVLEQSAIRQSRVKRPSDYVQNPSLRGSGAIVQKTFVNPKSSASESFYGDSKLGNKEAVSAIQGLIKNQQSVRDSNLK